MRFAATGNIADKPGQLILGADRDGWARTAVALAPGNLRTATPPIGFQCRSKYLEKLGPLLRAIDGPLFVSRDRRPEAPILRGSQVELIAAGGDTF